MSRYWASLWHCQCQHNLRTRAGLKNGWERSLQSQARYLAEDQWGWQPSTLLNIEKAAAAAAQRVWDFGEGKWQVGETYLALFLLATSHYAFHTPWVNFAQLASPDMA